MDYAAWDEALAQRLAPVREQLNLPVAALPRELGKRGTEAFESIDWSFPSYDAQPGEVNDKVQRLNITLAVRLYFKKRYPKGEEKVVLEWAELQILRLLTGYELPDSRSCLTLESGKLGTEQGLWYKEILFTFESLLISGDELKPPLPVIQIKASDSYGQLMEVKS